MNPILKYPGAKWRLSKWILSNMPPHESYVEPYFGSGAVFFNKTPARIETINDIDGDIVQFFRTCRDHPHELARAIDLTPWSREEFELAQVDDVTVTEVERARRFAVRCWMCFGARANSKTWRHSTGSKLNGGPDNPKLWARMTGVVEAASVRLREAQIEHRPAVSVIKAYNGPEVLIYADPPYPKSTRTLHGDQYRHEMTDEEHQELLNVLLEHRGQVLLSGYDCDLYQENLSDWKMIATGAQAELGAHRTECLWINPEALRKLKEQ